MRIALCRPRQRLLRGEPPTLQTELHRRQAERLAEFLIDQFPHRLRRPQPKGQLHPVRHLITDPALDAPRFRPRQHKRIANALPALSFLEPACAVAPECSTPTTAEVGDALATLDLDARMLDAALRAAVEPSQRWLALPPIELTSVAREIVERVTVAADRIDIRMSRAKVAAALKAGAANRRPDLNSIVLSIEAKLRRAGKGKRLVIENGAEAEVTAGLIATIAEALAIRNRLLSGPDDSIEGDDRAAGDSSGPPHFAGSAVSQPTSWITV